MTNEVTSFEYTLDKNDFLVHQLYIADTNPRIRKKKMRNKWILTATYAGIAILFLFIGKNFAATAFLMLSGVWWLFFPKYERRRYFKHYSDYIHDNYKERFEKKVRISFESDKISSSDDLGKGEMSYKSLKEIIELSNHYLIRLSSGMTLILPLQKMESAQDLSETLKEIAETRQIKYTKDTDWKW